MRPHPLLDTGRQPPPFLGGENARDDVEGDEPFRCFALAIDSEGDAFAAENALGLARRTGRVFRRQGFQPLFDTRIGLADLATQITHLVEQCAHAPATPNLCSAMKGEFRNAGKKIRRGPHNVPADPAIAEEFGTKRY